MVSCFPKWEILAVVLFVLLGAFMATRLGPPMYAATSKILLHPQGENPTPAGFPRGKEVSIGFINTQTELLKSRPLIERALRMINHLRVGNRQWGVTHEEFLQEALTVRNPKGSTVLEVTVQDTDPLRACRLAGAVADSYVMDNTQQGRSQASFLAEFIETELGRVERDLATAEADLKFFKVGHKLVSPSEEARSLIERSAQAEITRQRAQIELAEAQERVRALSNRVGLSVAQVHPLTALGRDQALQKLSATLIEAETDPLLGLPRQFVHPQVQRARAHIADLRQELAVKVTRAVEGHLGEPPLDPARRALLGDLIRAESDRLIAEMRLQAGERLNRQFQTRLAALPAQETAVTRLVRRREVLGEIQKMLLKKRTEARLAEVTDTGNARVVERPVVPDRPVSSRQAIQVLLGSAVGLGLGLGLVVLRRLLRGGKLRADNAGRRHGQ